MLAQRRAVIVNTLHCGDGLVVAEMGAVCVVIWRGEVTQVSFAWQKAGLAHVVRSHPAGAAFLCVIEPTAKPPDDELRKASTRMVDDHGDQLKCVAVVVEGEGFRAAIARSVISGMALLHQRKSPGRAFSNVRKALEWIDGIIPLDATHLAQEVEGQRVKLGFPP
jgi:hypothetical protein